LAYEWVERKLTARMQNRVGPRWFQPLADVVKLLAKEEIIPEQVNRHLFYWLPIIALAGALTAMLYIPTAGVPPVYGFAGDLIVVLYLLSLLTLATGVAGANTENPYAMVGATRALTQMFSYEAPFFLAILGPAFAAGSWQVSEISDFASNNLLIVLQPIGFAVAVIGLMGKLEMAPFDAPEAETEIVAGVLTEYSGRGLALFYLSRSVEWVAGLTLIAAFYLGGIHSPVDYILKTGGLLIVISLLHSLLTRLRIDQTVGLWWHYGVLLALFQWVIIILGRGAG
jgi:NADH-quinone oxidoreductase subunit H